MSNEGMFIKFKHGTILLVLLHVLIGFYFINYAFSFIEIPKFISNFDKWITLIGGLLILFGTINYFRAKKRR